MEKFESKKLSRLQMKAVQGGRCGMALPCQKGFHCEGDDDSLSGSGICKKDQPEVV